MPAGAAALKSRVRTPNALAVAILVTVAIVETWVFYYPGELPLSVHLVWIAIISPLVVCSVSR